MTKRITKTPASVLVILWTNSIVVSILANTGKTSPLHNGQSLPQPAPDPVARTTAPQSITRTVYTTNAQE